MNKFRNLCWLNTRFIELLVFTVVISFITSCGSKPPVEVFPPSPCPDEGGPMIFFTNPNFCLDTYEVSNGEYRKCVEANKCTEPNDIRSITRLDDKGYYGNLKYDDFPVIQVPWNQAVAYCVFVGKRLPRADEWARAAASNNPPDDITEYDDTQAVGSIGDVSNEGVHDLAGNVREWVDDEFKGKTDHRTVKGKYFASNENDPESYRQNKVEWGLGFRCAADKED